MSGVPLRAALRQAFAARGGDAAGRGRPPAACSSSAAARARARSTRRMLAALPALDPARVDDRAPDRRERPRARRGRLRAAGFDAVVTAFERDMPARYRWARPRGVPRGRDHGRGARARGAARRCSCRYPHAGGDHQRANARELERAGAARVLDSRNALARGRSRASSSPCSTTRRCCARWAPARRRSRSPTPPSASPPRAARSRRAAHDGRFRGIERIHFVGIGGIGMCGIAEVLRDQGYAVTGSDLRESATVARLRALGIPVALGHDAAKSGGPTSWWSRRPCAPDNPEVVAGAAARHPGDPARRDAGRADAPEGRHRGRRHARQDHDHLAGRARARRRRARPDVVVGGA